jgi:hypothetical protein
MHVLATTALILSTLVAPAAPVPVTDPVPTEPVTSSIGLVLQEYASFPQSTTIPAPIDSRLMRVARINTIMEVPDRSGRRAVPDLNGALYFVKNGTPHVYLDVAAQFAPQFFSGRGLGMGFGYVTFHPNFRRNGLFYTIHSELASTTTAKPDYVQPPTTLYHSVITEWHATDPRADTFAGTHREVLRIGFAFQVHNIQEINFNPTAKRGDRDYGKLYLAVGDGNQGATGDTPQNLAIPHGKLLRIDPRGTNAPNGRYGIPPGNPFVGRPGALGEIYAYGMRDPHRFSWDRATGRLYLGHIGEHAVESIYEVRSGDNLGWSQREGHYIYDKTAANPCDRLLPLPADDSGFVYPVAEYDHNPAPGWNCRSDVGVAVAGGFVYRGRDVPALRGKYVFGDLVDGRVLYTEVSQMRRGKAPATVHRLNLFDTAGRPVRMQELSSVGAPGDPERVDLRFGTDSQGELYLLAKANGKIWKVAGTKRYAAGPVGTTRVRDTLRPTNWAPITPSKWEFTGKQVILKEPGVARPGPRRPFEYAILTAGPALSAVDIRASVRIDEAVEVSNRDVIIVFGWQSDTRFYYAHLSTDNTIYPHNGIFKVNDADRVRLEYQWNGRSRGANPAIVDQKFHDVRVKYLPSTGEIAVYLDGSRQPLMTARDSTFQSGRVGFGSFDNFGRLRSLKVTGTPAS